MDRDTKIGVTTNERDLGVQIDPDLKFNQHVETVTSKANRMLGMIRRAYTYKDGGTIKKLYTSLIRPILEYGNAAWVPSLKREQQQIENVQRRATKMVPELRNLQYTDRLRVMKLPSMYYRRARGDMIEVYKYLHGQYNVEKVPLLLDEIRVTRGHSRRLKKERVETRQRRNHFRHRTVNRWNSLTEEVVSAPSLNSFKSRLDELWRGYTYIQNDCFPVRTHREDQLTGF